MTLAQARPEDRDATLLRAATALFCQEPIHDRDAIRRYEQLAIHLLPKLSPNDRAYVASLLGGRSDAPPAVMRLLARDAIGIAGPVLLHSTALSTIDLLGVIAVTGPDHHQLIAGRSDLSADVLRALDIAREKYSETAPKPAAKSAPQMEPPQDVAADAGEAETPKVPTAPSAPAADVDDFLDAPQDRRLRILGEAASRRWRARGTGRSLRLDEMLEQSFAATAIVHAAKKRDRPALVEAFSRALGITNEVATRLLYDPSGEPLVLMIRAAGLSDADGRTVLLLANKQISESVDKFFRLADLYASLEPSTAEAFIEAWRPEAETKRRPTHVPVYVEGAERPAAAARPDVVEQPQKRAKKA